VRSGTCAGGLLVRAGGKPVGMPGDASRPPIPRFEIDVRQRDADVDVRLAGDLDMAATFRLEPAIDRAVDQEGVRQLVLDLGEVGFIDSAGLGALLSIRERTRSLGIEMRLANVSPPAQRFLKLSGTQAAFD
jgi:anti-anti-sigma factor